MFRFTLLILVSLHVPVHAAREAFSEKKQLYDLLEERQARFGFYLESLDQKTGFFGSRSKHDLKGTIGVLKEIVETDNKIIAILNRAIDFKVFEKSKMNYDILERDQQLRRAKENLSKLQSRVGELEAREGRFKWQVRLQWLLVALLGAAAGAYYYLKIRKGAG